jgi:hypothetical protein
MHTTETKLFSVPKSDSQTNQRPCHGCTFVVHLSKVFLQYTEHTVIYDILLHNNILGYFRYVDDILIVCDSGKTDITNVVDSFNTATHSMQFTVEKEQNNQISFLDITIKKEYSHIAYNIHRKPTATDIIVPQESCHPTENKHSAITYLQNRNETYLTDEHSKQQEQHIINHTLRNNG